MGRFVQASQSMVNSEQGDSPKSAARKLGTFCMPDFCIFGSPNQAGRGLLVGPKAEGYWGCLFFMDQHAFLLVSLSTTKRRADLKLRLVSKVLLQV